MVFSQRLQKNLKRSILLNRLSGIKIASRSKEILMNSELPEPITRAIGLNKYPVFQILRGRDGVLSKKLQRGFSIFSFGGGVRVALLERDFEAKVIWLPIIGDGHIKLEKKITLVGNSSIKVINNKPDKIFIAQTDLNQTIRVSDPIFLVMLVGGTRELGKDVENYNMVTPTLILEATGSKEIMALRMAKVNDGISSYIIEDFKWGAKKWVISSFIGILLPGEFNLKLQLAALGGQSVIFDGISLFSFSIPK